MSSNDVNDNAATALRPIRALTVGALLCMLVVYMAQYSVNIIHGSYLAIDHMPAGGIFLFFVFAGFVCALLSLFKRSLGFNSAELVLIYTMLLVTSSTATMGLGCQFIPLLAGPHYYATPENRWEQLILPHISPCFVPRGSDAIRWLFEGMPAGESIPWSAWIIPFATWFPFLFALYFAMISLMVILRRQWVEVERLVFPLCQLPLAMVEEDKDKSRVLRPFFRNKLMWVGFAIPFLIGTLNGLHHHFYMIPKLELVKRFLIFRRTTSLQLRLSFPVLGLAYFINLKAALGLWLFNLIATTLRSVFLITGIYSTENMGAYGAWSPIFKHLGMGAMVTYVLYSAWSARDHLKRVFKKAVFNDKNVDDSQEIIPFRAAFWGLVASLIYITWWLYRSGLPLGVAALLVATALLIFVGLTRVVAETGVPTLIAPSIAPPQIVSSLGTAALGAQGLVALGFTYIWCADIRTFVMSAAAHGLRLSDIIRNSKRVLFWAMILAVAIGVIGSSIVVLKMAYDNGGANMNRWYFNGNIRVAFSYVANKMKQPEGPNKLGWICKGIGAVVMAILMFAHRRILWWPLHPVGFVVGANGWMNALWFSIFLAWVIKACILKFGGPNLFNKSKPLFLGLVLGQYTCSGMWFVIDALTHTTDNVIFWI